jgi:predicted Fe-Mo cluster-binding NifX family protein
MNAETPAATIACIPVAPDGAVGHGWGRAERVAIASLDASGLVAGWAVHDVRWDLSHPAGGPGPRPVELTAGPGPAARGGGEGAHHARSVRFLRDEGVTLAVAEHMGPGMRHVIGSMDIDLVLGADGDARSCVEAAAQLIRQTEAEEAAAEAARANAAADATATDGAPSTDGPAL